MEQVTETWEQKMAREKKEKTARCNQFASDITAAYKLCGLEIIPQDNNDGFRDRVTASLPKTSKSAYISASIDRYGHKGRICIGLWYQGQLSARDVWGYDAKHVEITVSETKTAEQVASDIKRRILPTLAESIKKADAVIKSRSDYKELSEKNIRLLGGDPKTRGPYSDNYTVHLDGFGSATVSGDNVRLDLYSVNAKTAKAIIDLLKRGE